MSIPAEFIIHTDGGARGNPGPAAFAVVLQRPGEPDIEIKGFLGKTTNNVAEYTALVRALELAKNVGGRRLLIHSDSELMVQQMNGAYKVKNEGLLPLYRQARDLVKEFDQVTIRHVRREQNKRADALCNEAMDNPGDISPPLPVQPARKAALPENGSAAGLAFLADCARLWARGNPQDPEPAEVFKKILKMVEKDS
jgi:ribonuclease HI